jgi:hypothetical protein
MERRKKRNRGSGSDKWGSLEPRSGSWLWGSDELFDRGSQL